MQKTFMAVLVMVLSAGWTPLPEQQGATGSSQPSWAAASMSALEEELTAKYGEASRSRLQRGLHQVLQFWRDGDGDKTAFEQFVRVHFAADDAARDTLLSRFERMVEALDGHMNEISRTLRTQADLDIGPILPFDELFAGYDPEAHLTDDFFANKLAFVALLNFPLTTLDERLKDGPAWTRRQWAEARLAARFARRVPASVKLEIARVTAEVDQYIAEYNIWMHHVVDGRGNRLFPAGKRLLSHWNLRDELKASYEDKTNGVARQRLIQSVMERIVTQTIPGAVINNPGLDWEPVANTVTASPVNDAGGAVVPSTVASAAPEPDTRYAMLLKTFQAERLRDPYSPTTPTLIARRFNVDRELPEERVKKMLEQVVSSPLVPRVAELIRQRLGRPLEPFDIWYNGFRVKSSVGEVELDRVVAGKYPNADAFKRDIPSILTALGFTPERSRFLAGLIAVDPARGSGHAMGAGMRGVPTRLRTRVEQGGMNYKGFNIAVHELGHNVEQVISLNDIDHTILSGVPNTAFTEAIAFVFQAQDLRLLGLAADSPKSHAMNVLNDFWGTYEIAGVALLDMAVWHWMYDHPQATPAELKAATLDLARGIWNTYYAPVFGKRDVVLLGIYSHMIHSTLYLPDYPIGHLIAHQLEERIKKGESIGSEIERVARIGRVTPDLWMTQAAGSAVGAEALLEAAGEALKQVTG
ncbi:MAG: hypothetical protein H6Q29_920 [Bacteroidetes bacterium]|nr:hypothetical protein [Bacteroidota bacterium]